MVLLRIENGEKERKYVISHDREEIRLYEREGGWHASYAPGGPPGLIDDHDLLARCISLARAENLPPLALA